MAPSRQNRSYHISWRRKIGDTKMLLHRTLPLCLSLKVCSVQADWISRGRKYGDLYRVRETVLLGAGGHRAICVIHTDPIPCPSQVPPAPPLHSPAWSELRNISSPPSPLDAVEEDDVSLIKEGITSRTQMRNHHNMCENELNMNDGGTMHAGKRKHYYLPHTWKVKLVLKITR